MFIADAGQFSQTMNLSDPGAFLIKQPGIAIVGAIFLVLILRKQFQYAALRTDLFHVIPSFRSISYLGPAEINALNNSYDPSVPRLIESY